jgi:nucleoid-associated protein YgaU
MKNIFQRTLIGGIIVALCGCLPTPGSVTKQGLTSAQKKKIQKTKEDLKEFPRASAVVANSLFEQGQYFEERGMDDEAVRQYKNALALKPPFSDMIHYNMGLIYYRQDLLEQSAGHLQESIALNPDYVYSRFWLGIVAIESEDYQRGVQELENALKINPEFSDCFYYIGLAYDRSQRSFEKAVSSYKRYLLHQPRGDKAADAQTSIKHLEKLLADLRTQKTPGGTPEKISGEPSAGGETREPPAETPAQQVPSAEDVKTPAVEQEAAPVPAAVETPAAPQTPSEDARPACPPAAAQPAVPPAAPVVLETDEAAPLLPPVNKRTYTVKANETLWIIAGHQEIYDNDSLWPFIFEANRDILKGKKKLEKGMVLRIPTLDPSVMEKKPVPAKKKAKAKRRRPKDAKAGAAPQQVTPKQLPAQHTVAEGETLWIIAGYPAYYNDDKKWTLIYEENKDILKGKKILLPAGIVLTIPKISEKATDQGPVKITGQKKGVRPAPVSVPPGQTPAAVSPFPNIKPARILDAAGAIASFWARSTLGAIAGAQKELSTAANSMQNKPSAPELTAPAPSAVVKQEPLQAPPAIKPEVSVSRPVPPQKIQVKGTSAKPAARPAQEAPPAVFKEPSQKMFQPEKPRMTFVEQQLQEQKSAQQASGAAGNTGTAASSRVVKAPEKKHTQAKPLESVKGTARNESGKQTAKENAEAAIHTVSAGETLSQIARAHGVSLKALMKANGITDPDSLLAGQKLTVPEKTGRAKMRRTKTQDAKVLKTTSYGKGAAAAAGRKTSAPKNTGSAPPQ